MILTLSVAEEHKHTEKQEGNPLFLIIKHHFIGLLTLANKESNISVVLHLFCVSSGLSLK